MKLNKKILLVVTLVFVILLPLFIENPYVLHSICMIILYAYLATAWNIVGGFAGQLSLGHSAFLAIGAYTSSLLYIEIGLTPWLGMIVGGIIAALIAVLIGLPSFRLRGAYYALATLAFAEGFRRLLESTKQIGNFSLGGAEGLSIPIAVDGTFWDFQFLSKVPYYFIFLVFLIIILFVSWKLERTKLGYYLTAIRENEDAAKALGINTRNVKLIAAGTSAFFTAIGGTLLAQLIRFLEPASIAGFDFSAQMVFLAIVGGIGTVFGPLFGSLLLVTIGEITRATLGDFIPGFHLILYGIAVVLVILYYPKGIYVAIKNFLDKRKKGMKSDYSKSKSA